MNVLFSIGVLVGSEKYKDRYSHNSTNLVRLASMWQYFDTITIHVTDYMEL